jgi:hypothetical protein
MNDEHWATVIKIAAVAVAAPRWIGALLEAEGVPLPAEWRGWWVIFSAVCAAGMALVCLLPALVAWYDRAIGQCHDADDRGQCDDVCRRAVALHRRECCQSHHVSPARRLGAVGVVSGGGTLHDPDHRLGGVCPETPDADATGRHPRVNRQHGRAR